MGKHPNLPDFSTYVRRFGMPSSTLTRRAVMAYGGLAASGVSAQAPSQSPMVLTVAAYPLVDEIARAALPQWRLQYPHVEVQVQTRQYADHNTAMTTALSTTVLLPDVMAIDAGLVGRFANGGGLEDLAQAPYHAGQLRKRMVPYAYDQAISATGRVVAMPTDIGPGTLLYRKDVLDRAGVSEEDLTRSWESYIAAGVRIKAKTGAYLIGSVQLIKDIVISSGLQPGQGVYFDKDSNVLVRSPRFVQAFELAREVRKHKLDARVTAWSNEWAEGFKRGTLASEPTGAWMVGQLSNWIAPKTHGLWRAAQLPGGAAVAYGGSFYALPRRADPQRKAMAWEFVQFMTQNRDRQLQAFKQYDAFPALLETHNDPFFDAPVDFLGGQKARSLWRDAAQRITAVPVHKQNTIAAEVIGTELDKVLDQGKDIPLALADAQRLLEQRAHR